MEAMLAVNPVPWARAQMAFTLAAHIILVPLGVSWAFMALIANYRGIKRNDADALELAQRWSKYMAVTFAVGAVTGTVLTFEFGLLWPKFMGQWGEAFGIPFAFEGLSRLEITRVACDGTIERMKAGASTDLADTAFFSHRLAAQVGEGLGLGVCRALACESAEEGIVVFQGRSIVGARGALADLQFVLAKVGLE